MCGMITWMNAVEQVQEETMSLNLLGVSDTGELRRDGPWSIEAPAHRGAGHIKRTWQSWEGDVCLGFACSGCALIAGLFFARLEDTDVWDPDWGNNRPRQRDFVGGVKHARGSAGGKQGPMSSLRVANRGPTVDPFSTRTHYCCGRIVDEKGKASNKVPGDWRDIWCDMTP